MKLLALLAAPALVRYLLNRRKRDIAPGVPTEANLDRPQDQTRAMESAVDVPGGVRP